MLILLDIDGVMVPAKGHQIPDCLEDGFAAFSNKATHALNQLIKELNATIVLTTSHKEKFSTDKWKVLFRNRGIEVTQIQSLPANLKHLSRKEEIIEWFKVNTFEDDFIILDDDKSLNALPSLLKARLILTSSYIGLTDEHVNLIRSIRQLK